MRRTVQLIWSGGEGIRGVKVAPACNERGVKVPEREENQRGEGGTSMQ